MPIFHRFRRRYFKHRRVKAPPLASPGSVNIAGVSGTGSVGTVVAKVETGALSGVFATGAIGTVTPQVGGVVTGVAGIGAIGSLAFTSTISISGVGAVGAIGAAIANVNALVSGVAGAGAVGTAVASTGIPSVYGTGVVGATVPSVYAYLNTYGFEANSYISTSRASPATTYAPDSAGNLITFYANQPRITGRGLLVEESRANVFLHSQEFDVSPWFTGGSTVSADTMAAPDATATADLVLETATTANHSVAQTCTVAALTTYTQSCYAKKRDRDYISFDSNIGGTSNRTWFDIANGTVGTVNAGQTAQIEDAGNGWYRCSATFTTSAATSFTFYVELNTADGQGTYAGDITKGNYLWGAQLELGSFPTSYIPTTSAAVTRSADSVQATGLLKATLQGASASVFGSAGPLPGSGRIVGSSPNAQSLPIAVATQTSISNGAASVFAVLGSGSFSTGTALAACSWDASGRSVVGAGGTVGTDSNTQNSDSSYFIGSRGSEYINGFIQRVAVWDTRLADATLQAYTAGTSPVGMTVDLNFLSTGTGVYGTGQVGTVNQNLGPSIMGVAGVGAAGQAFAITPSPIHRPPLLIPSMDGYPASLWLGE